MPKKKDIHISTHSVFDDNDAGCGDLTDIIVSLIIDELAKSTADTQLRTFDESA